MRKVRRDRAGLDKGISLLRLRRAVVFVPNAAVPIIVYQHTQHGDGDDPERQTAPKAGEPGRYTPGQTDDKGDDARGGDKPGNHTD